LKKQTRFAAAHFEKTFARCSIDSMKITNAEKQPRRNFVAEKS